LNPKVSQHIDYGLQHKFAIKRIFTMFFVNIVVEGIWLWRISGSYSFRNFYRSIWNFLSQLRQWDSRL